jgi:molecular chaperone DnaK (HSP70)
LNNVKIGEFRVEGLQDVKAGNVIILTLELDLNGILQVSAIEKLTGLEKSITIQNAFSYTESGKLDTAKQRITSLFGKLDSSLYEQDEDEQEEQVVTPEVETAYQLITKAEDLFDKVSKEDKEDMSDLIGQITKCIDSDEKDDLENTVAQLKDIIYYLGS